MSFNSVCNHDIRDKQIGLPLRGRPILLSLLWEQTELDATPPYYHYKFQLIWEGHSLSIGISQQIRATLWVYHI